MLLYAVLACGACHPSLAYDEHAHSLIQGFYDKATGTLRQLQNSHRDKYLCTVTTLVLSVFEMMTEKALQKTTQFARARALVKDCGWNARSSGTAAGCFWFSVSTDLLNCIIYDRITAQSPDEWDYRLESGDSDTNPKENARTPDDWVHSILYILAQITRYRNTVTQPDVLADSDAVTSWENLEHMCMWWRKSIPHALEPINISGLSIFDDVRTRSSFPLTR